MYKIQKYNTFIIYGPVVLLYIRGLRFFWYTLYKKLEILKLEDIFKLNIAKFVLAPTVVPREWRQLGTVIIRFIDSGDTWGHS